MKNPIFLTDQELLEGAALLRANARALESSGKYGHSTLTAQDQTVIEAIYLYPQRSAREIALKLRIHQPALSRSIKSLTSLKYITVTPDPDDQRIKRLALSTKGQQNYTMRQQLRLEVFLRAYQRAGISAVEGFRTVLRALARSLEEQN